VKWAAGGELSIYTDAPEMVTIEVTEKKDQSYLMLHLLNYNTEHHSISKIIRVSLKVPDNIHVESVQGLSPDSDNIRNIDFRVENNRIVVVIPELKTYYMVALKLK
jgi:hypothetical protein